VAVDECEPLEVETDTSEVAIAATLNQNGRPVALFSKRRFLKTCCVFLFRGSELKHPSIEKEAQAIIEVVCYWKHYLTSKHFILQTDQKSVTFMFNQKHKGKIKNDKILHWQIELSCYSFDIVYKPGWDNIPPDALSRISCALPNDESLRQLHDALYHPVVTRLAHFIRIHNLPYSIADIKRVVSNCQICCECKPQFYRPQPGNLVKATQPFERLNIDFKGPLPSNNQNKYFLNVVDEYFRFPFVFPCCDLSTESIIKALTSLFTVYGMPACIHSDRGASFISRELREFPTSKGVSTSRTTSYNPAGNGQVERYNGVIWKGISLSLRSKSLPLVYWQEDLPDILHSVRSLLCTATNCTPHERLFG